MDILERLRWRYATKKFDPEKKITEEQLQRLLEAINLTPTSMGMQALGVVVVEDKELRLQLREASNNQSQVTDASHYLVMVRPTQVTDKHVEDHASNIMNIRSQSRESVEGYIRSAKNFLTKYDIKEIEGWASKQVYIALGNLLTTCAVEEIDACPMEGFNNQKYDEILNLEALGWKSVVCVAVGYRLPEDKYATLPKVRKPLQKLVVRL